MKGTLAGALYLPQEEGPADDAGGHEVDLSSLAGYLLPARQLEAREKRGRLSTGVGRLDALLGGGWPRGAVSELWGPASSGRTAVLLASLASALDRGEVVALVDGAGAFDPRAASRAGVALDRVLWVRLDEASSGGRTRGARMRKMMTAVETIAGSGGFGLVVLDLGERAPAVPSAAWLRLRRIAQTQGTTVLVVAGHRIQGVLGACALTLQGGRVRFAGGAQGPPLLLHIETRAEIARNLGARVDAPGAPCALRFCQGQPRS